MSEMRLPCGWIMAPVVDVADRLTKGTTPTTAGYEYKDRGVLFVKVESIESHVIIHDRCAYIDEAAHAALSRSQLAVNDVLISIAGTLGRVGIVREVDVPGNTNQALAIIRTSGRVEPEYLAHALESFLVRQAVAEGGRGIGLQNLNLAQISRLPLLLAPLSEQRRIVAALESYFSRLDDAVATLERVERNLKRYRASVLKSAVEGRLVPTEAALAKQEGRTYEPASVLLERILTERRRRWSESGKKGKYQEPTPPVTTNLPKLPDGWCWTTMTALLSQPLRNGHSAVASTDGLGVRTLTLTAVTVGDFSEANTKLTVADPAKVEDLWLERGDLLIERSNTAELVGTARLYRGESNYAIFPDLVIRARVLPLVSDRYLELVLHSPRVRLHFQRAAQGIAGSMPKISQGTIEALPVPLPPLAEQVRIALALEESDTSIAATSAVAVTNARRLKRLRQSILKWAFEGKLADQDPNDEPASVLLDRIKAERNTPKPAKTAAPQRKAAKKKARA